MKPQQMFGPQQRFQPQQAAYTTYTTAQLDLSTIIQPMMTIMVMAMMMGMMKPLMKMD